MSLDDKKARNWLREIGIDGKLKFDLKNEDLILYDGGLVSIKKHTRKHRGKFDANKFREDACTIWFNSIDETIEYLKKARSFLVEMGYDTGTRSQKIKANIYK